MYLSWNSLFRVNANFFFGGGGKIDLDIEQILFKNSNQWNGDWSLKLTCHHINRRHICFNIKSISVHHLLWMNVMLDFICMIFAELWSTESKRKIQNDNVCLHRDSNQRPLALQRDTLTTQLSGQITTLY